MNLNNPDALTPEQVEISQGYRLLEIDEVGPQFYKATKEIERWRPYGLWSNAGSGCYGSDYGQTYRTKLSKEELRKVRES